jgi:hypothetical protein
MDTWVLMTLRESGRYRCRDIAVLKSRGMAHSTEIRGFVMTDGGFIPHDVRTDGHAPHNPA